jgi:hypothetical protein
MYNSDQIPYENKEFVCSELDFHIYYLFVDVEYKIVYRNAATHLVEQELLYCGNEAGKLLAFRQLVQKGLKPPVLGDYIHNYEIARHR